MIKQSTLTYHYFFLYSIRVNLSPSELTDVCGVCIDIIVFYCMLMGEGMFIIV